MNQNKFIVLPKLCLKKKIIKYIRDFVTQANAGKDFGGRGGDFRKF